MNRRSFLTSLIGGIAATAAVRIFPFRVYSFPSAIRPVAAVLTPQMLRQLYSVMGSISPLEPLTFYLNKDQEVAFDKFMRQDGLGELIEVHKQQIAPIASHHDLRAIIASKLRRNVFTPEPLPSWSNLERDYYR